MMATYVWKNGALVDKDTGAQSGYDPKAPPSLPMIVNDTFDKPVLGMDGKMYSGKRALSSANYRMGYNEMGNEAPSKPEKPKVDRRARREELRSVIRDVKNGDVPDSIKAIQ